MRSPVTDPRGRWPRAASGSRRTAARSGGRAAQRGGEPLHVRVAHDHAVVHLEQQLLLAALRVGVGHVEAEVEHDLLGRRVDAVGVGEVVRSSRSSSMTCTPCCGRPPRSSCPSCLVLRRSSLLTSERPFQLLPHVAGSRVPQWVGYCGENRTLVYRGPPVVTTAQAREQWVNNRDGRSSDARDRVLSPN